MHMGIVKARENGILMRIDDAGLCAGQRLDLGVRTNGNDVVIEDGERGGGGVCAIHRPDRTVKDDEVGCEHS
jgi:hypothetical protein